MARFFRLNALGFVQNAYLCPFEPHKNDPMDTRSQTKKHHFTIWAFLMLAIVACHQRPASTLERIQLLKEQVETDSKALQNLENEAYPHLDETFRHCDSMLQYMDSTQWDKHFDQLNLAQAYLRQFSAVKDDMRQKMDYSLVQLDRLRNDVESQYISDSLAMAYFETETKVADTLHSRVAYFQDRFANSQKALSAIKKARH